MPPVSVSTFFPEFLVRPAFGCTGHVLGINKSIITAYKGGQVLIPLLFWSPTHSAVQICRPEAFLTLSFF